MSSETQRNLRLDGYGSWFGPPRVCRSGILTGLEPNRLVVGSKSAPLGGYPNPLLKLPPSACADRLDHSLQVYLNTCTFRPTECISLNSLNHGLQVPLQTRSIMASVGISTFAQSRTPSASLNSANLGLQVDLQTRTIAASKSISNSLDNSLQAYLYTHLIRATECISPK